MFELLVTVVSAAEMVVLYYVIDRPRNRDMRGPFNFFGVPLYTHHFPEAVMFLAIGPIVRTFLPVYLAVFHAPAEPLVAVFPLILLPLTNAVLYVMRHGEERRQGLQPDPLSAHLSVYILIDCAFLLGYYL